MAKAVNILKSLLIGSIRSVSAGNWIYYAWLAVLGVVILQGVQAYGNQAVHGLITTNMRDQVSWGFYIGNFAFLVGVAAAAVVLVIPAYVYNWGPIREVVLFGELLSISAIVMSILFVTIDVGRPQFLWHLAPGVGTPNFPHSLLTWDILVLNGYFVINSFIVGYLPFRTSLGNPYSAGVVMPVIFLSIPFAIGIHTVTAFLFMGLHSRAFWHTAILAPRFIAGAFCSGPALLFLIFQVMRRLGRMKIPDAALYKIGELLAYAMAVNLFFVGSEVFTDFYAVSSHTIHAYFQWFGIEGNTSIATYTWISLTCDVVALIIFMVPALRHQLNLLSFGCVLSFGGIFIEKGMGLMLPGMTPDNLGESYAYSPSLNEALIGAGVWAIGALVFTILVKLASSINLGLLRYEEG